MEDPESRADLKAFADYEQLDDFEKSLNQSDFNYS